MCVTSVLKYGDGCGMELRVKELIIYILSFMTLEKAYFSFLNGFWEIFDKHEIQNDDLDLIRQHCKESCDVNICWEKVGKTENRPS